MSLQFFLAFKIFIIIKRLNNEQSFNSSISSHLVDVVVQLFLGFKNIFKPFWFLFLKLINNSKAKDKGNHEIMHRDVFGYLMKTSLFLHP